MVTASEKVIPAMLVLPSLLRDPVNQHIGLQNTNPKVDTARYVGVLIIVPVTTRKPLMPDHQPGFGRTWLMPFLVEEVAVKVATLKVAARAKAKETGKDRDTVPRVPVVLLPRLLVPKVTVSLLVINAGRLKSNIALVDGARLDVMSATDLRANMMEASFVLSQNPSTWWMVDRHGVLSRKASPKPKARPGLSLRVNLKQQLKLVLVASFLSPSDERTRDAMWSLKTLSFVSSRGSQWSLLSEPLPWYILPS